MKSRRRALHRSAWILAAGGVLLGVYLQVGFLPGRNLRENAIARIEEWTGRQVSFSKAVFLPGFGLSLDDFRFGGVDGPSLFSAKRLRLDVKILPFLFGKKIVIRNLLLESPSFDWSAGHAPPPPPPVKTQISGQLDVPVAPAGHAITFESLRAQGADALLPENVYLEQIEIRHGAARFHDEDGTLRETVEIADLKIAYRKPPVVDISGEIRVGSDAYATLRIKGGWDLRRAGYEFFLQFKSTRVPEWLGSFQQKHILILREGKIDLVAKLSSITEARAAFHAKARLAGARIQAAHASIRGQTSFDAKGVFDFDRQRFERYRGTLFLDSSDLENLSEQFPKIERVTGRVGFEPNLVTIESIRGHWKKLAFEAKGTIKSFKELLLNGEIRSKLEIEDALALIPPEQKKLLAGFRLGGTCDALTTLKGSLKKGGSVAHEHRLVVEHGFLENPERKLKLEDLATELYMNDKGLQIRNTRFRSAQVPFRLEASIPKKPASRGSLSLAAPAWKLRADYDVRGEDLQVRSGHADGYGASVSFSGLVQNIQRPALFLKGSVRADLGKLESSVPAPASNALHGAGLRGILEGPFSLTGPWNIPKRWDLRLDAKSDRVTVKDWCRLDRFEIQLRAKNGVVDVPYVHASPYGGTLGASYKIDMNRSPADFTMRVNGNRLDLGKIARDLLPPRKDLEGKLLFQLDMRGPLPDKSAWEGGGSMGITDGKFGRTDRFKDMGKLPFVRVEGMEDVTFHQMRAQFDIESQKIRTRNLAIYGNNVNLFLDGTIGFDSKLDLGMRIHYSDDILNGALDTGGIVPFVVSEADAMISDHRVSGTLASPVFQKTLLPVDPVKAVGKKVGGLTRAVVS